MRTTGNAAPITCERERAAAGVLRRAAAAVIDLLVVVGTLYALEAGVALSMIGALPDSPDHGVAAVVRECAVSLLVAVVYSAECWSRSGRTAGAAMLGLRVVGRDGSPLRPAEAVLRAVACMVFPIGLLSAAVDTRRRSLQDLAFGSRVIREHRRRALFAQPAL